MAPPATRLAILAAIAVLLLESSEALRIERENASSAPMQSSRLVGGVSGNEEVPNQEFIKTEIILKKLRGKPVCYDFNPAPAFLECHMLGKEKCKLRSMPRGRPSTMVYPGGNTRCLNNSAPRFAFQVFPGDTDKLWLLFDGGGAAWDRISTSVAAANKTSVVPHPDVGFLRRGQDHRSPFRNYTIVLVQYCSGDLHAGNVTMTYTDINGGPVKQMGYYNTMSAVQWALDNMDAKLKSLYISGVSAGGIAAEVWSSKLLNTFQFESARVLADSYVPVFPRGFQGKIFKRLGVCHTDLLEGDLKKQCNRGKVNIEDVYDATAKAFPQVAFGVATSANDFCQTAFSQLASLTMGDAITSRKYKPTDFHRGACRIIERYSQNPNFVSYVMDGDMHIFQMCDMVFEASQEVNGKRTHFVDWIRSFIGANGSSPVLSVANNTGGPPECTSLLNEKTLKLQS